jgi:ABC-type multidrug transport system ATPase subunit
VYHLFDDIILLCEGHIIYQGPQDSIIPYFQSIGYFCPKDMDEADFLQELPTIQGKRFASSSSPQNGASNTPVLPIRHSPKALARAWKNSSYYHALLSSMKYQSLEQAKQLEKENDKEWFPDEKEKYAKDSFLSIFLYYLPLNLSRQMKIFLREKSFTLITLIKVLIVGAITGSLFSNISKTDMTTLNGLLFFSVLYSALGSFFLIPLIFEQKLVFYKMKDALFFPTVSFTIAQSLTLVPLQLVENIIYITMVYWSAGLSSEHNGSRFLTFIVIAFSFTLLIAQLFRLMSAILPTSGTVMPLSGVIIVIMVLFSGFIQPKALISDGWIWFYYLNPVAWALKAVTVNELKSSKYDFLTCTDPFCLGTKRFGDFILEQYGNPTDERYIWYSLAVIIAEFLLLFAITTICLHYIRTVSIPAPPLRTDEGEQDTAVIPNRPDGSASKMILDAMESGLPQQAIQPSPSSTSPATLSFEPVSMAFKEISYTVTLSNGEDIDLLKEVDGFFEPGTLTCLMGSSGAGKTTLLDVLAGRKNTGVIKGEMYLNGVPKDDDYFRRINGYVEQFDTLPHKSTTREAITFSAALRLSRDVSA